MSKIQLSPYVNFRGRAREAMEFYQKVLGGNLDLQTFDELGASRPDGHGDRIRHSRLEADGLVIIATDGHPDYPPTVGDNMGIALGGTDRGRLTKIFNDLAEGGRIKMPLTKQPGGGDAGWLTDRFGIIWTVNIDRA